MAFFDEAQGELVQMLNLFDFSAAFPAGYTGTKGVVITDTWPVDLIDNMISETAGVMTVPVISVMLATANDTFRSLGNSFNSGPTTGTFTYATRVESAFLISAWADEHMGGAGTAKALAGLVQACAFINRSALTALRHLRMSGSSQAYQMAPQLWRVDATVEGDAIVSYYA